MGIKAAAFLWGGTLNMEGLSSLHPEINTERYLEGEAKPMRAFIDDLAGAIHDILGGFSYFLAGVLIVSAVMFLFVWVVRLVAG